MANYHPKPPSILGIDTSDTLSGSILAAWPMNSPSSSEAPRDCSGRNKHMTYNGVAVGVVPSQYGYSRHYTDTANKFCIFGTDSFFDLTKPFSISASFKIDSFGASTLPFLMSIITSGSEAFTVIPSSHNSYRPVSFGAGGIVEFKPTGGDTLSVGWHTLSMMYNGASSSVISNYTVVIDGENRALTTPAGLGAVPQKNYVGGRDAGSNNPWDGLIDNIVLYDTELTLLDASKFHQDPFYMYRKTNRLSSWIGGISLALTGNPYYYYLQQQLLAG
jgi:hypothetical protein